MPDLTADPDPTHVPPSTRPEAALDLTRTWFGQDRPDDETRDLTAPGSEVQRLLTVVLGLFDSLLVGIVGTGEIGAVVRALLSLALREAVRMRTAPRRDDEPDFPAAVIPSPLAGDVRRAIERHATGPVGPDVVERATMGVEFVARIEADHPGSVDAFEGV